MSPTPTTRNESARRLAEALVAGGYADSEALSALVDQAASTGVSFTGLLIARGAVRADVVLGVQSQLTQLPVVDLHTHQPASYAMSVAPVAVVREFGAIGFELQGEKLVMAFADPPDTEDLRTLALLVGHEIVPVLADPRAVERLWKAQEAMDSGAVVNAGADKSAPVPVDLGELGADLLAGALRAEAAGETIEMGNTVTAAAAPNGDGEVPMHLDDLLRYAVGVGASDLHLTSMMPACIRLLGAIRSVEGCPPLQSEDIRKMVFHPLPALATGFTCSIQYRHEVAPLWIVEQRRKVSCKPEL